MDNKIKFFIICIILSLFCIAAASANENSTDMLTNDSSDVGVEKEIPDISVGSSKVYANRCVEINLKDSNNTPISNKTLTANLNNKNYSLLTNDEGKASLKLSLKPNKYVLNVFFIGDDNYSSVNKTFNINVLKLTSSITPKSTTVLKNNYFYVYLKDNFKNPIKNKKVTFKVNSKTYTATTDENGKAGIKIDLENHAKYSMKISFAGNDYYTSVSKTITLFVPVATSINIGNNKLLSKGYLRIYLKSSYLPAISKKTVVIKINDKTFTKTTNQEGVIVFAPNVGAGKLNITAKYKGASIIAGSSKNKMVNGISGNVKDPTKVKIPLVNGVPDIDVMPRSYIMADGNMKYTLLKEHYLQTIKRDSYYLFLTYKLSKYVCFKTKAAPTFQHVIVREKWNVIERYINTKVVLANKQGYWPEEVTVSLKGKSYNYPQVRDVQNTGYTCGPTSCSMCTQFLKNYVCESQLSKLAKATSYAGTQTSMLKKALEQNNFRCSYYYKSSFSNAINELKKGGCCLVFHTWSHYVAILDISKDGNYVLVGNPSGDYDHGSHGIPTKWVSVSFMAGKFNNYDTSGLIVKLKYSLSQASKTQLKNTYSSFGAGWTAQNIGERIPQIS